MEFSRQEYWNGLPFPIPGDPPDPGIEPSSLASPALAGGFFSTALLTYTHYNFLICGMGQILTSLRVILCACVHTHIHMRARAPSLAEKNH